jgi:CheY-like chemotaxis protein
MASRMPKPSRERRTMPGLKRILLAEDDPRDVELTLQGLRAGQMANEVQVVSDGEEALDYLFARGRFAARVPGLPALLLLDLKMPRQTGLDVLREVRASTELARIPVVMMTSSRQQSDLEAAYRLGCNAFVVKPVGFREGIETVKALANFWAGINEPPPGCVQR